MPRAKTYRSACLCWLLVPLFCATALGVDQDAGKEGVAGRSEKPNVVVILSDDQAWGDYSMMGHPAIQTPRLDTLAKQSLTFTRGYVPDSLCRPSLATIISGLYPHQHGIVGNDPPWSGMETGLARPAHNDPAYLPNRLAYLKHIDRMTTTPDMLGPLGYRSLQTGKWWEGNYRRGGFTEGMTEGDFSRRGRHGDAGLTIGRKGMEPIETFLDSCQEAKDPFYLWYAPFLPHAPHNPPERFLAKYRDVAPTLPIAKYWAMCEWFDETCGQLLDALDQRGMTENTVIIYVCDNGWINQQTSSRYAARSKRSPNEGGIRTPIMVRWPGQVRPRMDTKTLASSIDIVPTIRAAVGLPPGDGLPGVNLMDETATSSRDMIFGEILEHDIQSIDDPAASLCSRWVIAGNLKLIDPSSRKPDARPELYDLQADPDEKNDLADSRPEDVKRLTAELDAWWNPPTS